ncbi:MAG: xanthine phosphoribosyltransferase [Spongiibacteraceae bacterium]
MASIETTPSGNITQDYFLSWEDLHRDTRNLAQQLIDLHQGAIPWQGIIAIARGGLIPAAILARELNLRVIDTLCIASYDHNQQGEPDVLKSIEGTGTGYLLVDDLVDTGITAKIAKQLLPEAFFVTLYAKPAGTPMTELFIKQFPQDTWLHFPWDLTHDNGNYNYSIPLAEQHQS